MLKLVTFFFSSDILNLGYDFKIEYIFKDKKYFDNLINTIILIIINLLYNIDIFSLNLKKYFISYKYFYFKKILWLQQKMLKFKK